MRPCWTYTEAPVLMTPRTTDPGGREHDYDNDNDKDDKTLLFTVTGNTNVAILDLYRSSRAGGCGEKLSCSWAEEPR